MKINCKVDKGLPAALILIARIDNNWVKQITWKLQKQSLIGVFWKKSSWKVRKIQRESSLPERESPPVCNFIKKETLIQMFSFGFCTIFRTSILQNTSGQLSLKMEFANYFQVCNMAFYQQTDIYIFFFYL